MKDLQRKLSGHLSSLGEAQEEETDDAINDNNTPENNDSTGNLNGSPARLPAIRERRHPTLKKRALSINEGSSDTSQRRESVSSNNGSTTPSRRSSIPLGATNINTLTRRASRPLFASIGRRVSTLVRARLAFQRRPSKNSSQDLEADNSMEVIHELPRNPRFSSFMSPEAQYAIMKGYEDKLYENLTGSFPESALILKRTKTPHHKISIRGKSASRPHARNEPIGEGSETGTEDDVGSSSSTSPSYVSNTPAATRAPALYMTSSDSSTEKSSDRLSPMSTPTSSSSPVPIPSPFLRPIGRRQSVHASTDVNGNSMTSASMSRMALSPNTWSSPLQRSSSLPTLPGAGLPHDRRLVLSYRLESAMDILDTIRRRNGECSLSPRVFRNLRPIVPVRDFNSWTTVWGKEFKELPAKS